MTVNDRRIGEYIKSQQSSLGLEDGYFIMVGHLNITCINTDGRYIDKTFVLAFKTDGKSELIHIPDGILLNDSLGGLEYQNTEEPHD